MIEKFGSSVDVVVRSGIRPADYHDCVAGCLWPGGVVDTIVIDGWLEKVRVLFKPALGISR